MCGVLSLDAGTVIDGLERGGIPYVERGERMRLSCARAEAARRRTRA